MFWQSIIKCTFIQFWENRVKAISFKFDLKKRVGHKISTDIDFIINWHSTTGKDINVLMGEYVHCANFVVQYTLPIQT